MKSILAPMDLLALTLLILISQQVSGAPSNYIGLSKVFNYLGDLPVKDDRTGEIIKSETNETAVTPSPAQAEAEAACWKMIVEQSAVTFALQNKVLDQLTSDMSNLKMDEQLRSAVLKISEKMRQDMSDANKALEQDAADEFFDALFDSSEQIIYLSALLRDPNMDEEVFLTLVKAVSRLGRNNSALVQEFTDMCSFAYRAPRPRAVTGSI